MQSSSARQRRIGYVALALLAYLPVLGTARGKVAADTKQYLYLDPGRLMSRAVSMWDPHVGMGSVTHQTIGYLFPMGPYYWTLDRLGAPDWVAQRVWLGSLLFAAALGVLYLVRTFGVRGPGVVVAAVAYMFTPYVLDYSARISVLLMPWAALPWMIGLVRKALRDGGWRYPALFALVIQVVGGVNATALLFAGIGPVLWILYAWLVAHDVDGRRAAQVGTRTGALTLLTSLWWIAGLRIQGAYGLNILKYTETVQAVARTSTPNEVLRGLGYWFFYGQDRLGPWIEAARDYTQHPVVIVAGYSLVALALLGAGLLRWRHRAFFVALLLVGVVVSVGAHPYNDPTPLGRVFKAFATGSTAGLAMRSTARAVPLVVLALAVLLGLGVNAAFRSLHDHQRKALAASVVAFVALLVVVDFPAVVDGAFYGKNLERPENVPPYWLAATRYLDHRGSTTRVLELPGSDFASYRWGNTVDPITPGLMDRPYVARELIPYGTAGSADLLNALDRRVQEGVTDPRGLVALLRRMGVGDVVLRNDIQFERYDLVPPRELNRVLAQVPGLDTPRRFGPPSAPVFAKPHQDEISLEAPADEPPVAPVVVYGVEDPTPIVRGESTHRALMVSGDGEGLVDVADVGLLDGAGAVEYSASYTDDRALRRAVEPDTVLVVTDNNRLRARRWTSVRDNLGVTDQLGTTPLRTDPGDARLDVFPGERASSLTTTEPRGVHSIAATSYGNTISYTPEDRAARAFDGDPDTAWRAAAFGDAIGERIRVELDAPITTDHVNLVQPLTGGRDRYITGIALRFDGRHEVRVRLDGTSRTDAGQTVTFRRRTFRTFEIRITAVNDKRRRLIGTADAVGFAEIRVRDANADHDVRVDEIERMPTDLLTALGADSTRHPLVLLMSRDRLRPVPPRHDPEAVIARELALPAARTFALTGNASVNPDADHAVIDRVLGIPGADRGGVSTDASEFLLGCLRCRADAAIDGDPTTAWQTPFVGVRDQWAQYTLPQPITFDHLDVQVIADGRHSVPTRLRLQVDDAVRDLDLPPVTDQPGENATTTVHLAFPSVTGRTVRVTIAQVREEKSYRFNSERQRSLLPAGIAELGVPGLRLPVAPVAIPGECRNDLVEIDGVPLPVRITGRASAAAALAGLDVAPCDPGDPTRVPTVELARGRHVLTTAAGKVSGISLDRLVLASAGGGGPFDARGGQVTGLGASGPRTARVAVARNGATKLRVHVTSASGPFWLVLGQSLSTGWHAHIAGGRDLGTPRLVDGYANGWRVRPTAPAFDVVLEWTPQRGVRTSLLISLAVALVCVCIALASWWRRRAALALLTAADPRDSDPALEWPSVPRGGGGSSRRRWIAPVLAGALAAVAAAPWVGVVVAVVVGAVVWRPRLRVWLALTPAVLLLLCGLYIVYMQRRFEFPPVFEWASLFPRARTASWIAVLLLTADVVVEHLRSPRRRADATARVAAHDERALGG